MKILPNPPELIIVCAQFVSIFICAFTAADAANVCVNIRKYIVETVLFKLNFLCFFSQFIFHLLQNIMAVLTFSSKQKNLAYKCLAVADACGVAVDTAHTAAAMQSSQHGSNIASWNGEGWRRMEGRKDSGRNACQMYDPTSNLTT